MGLKIHCKARAGACAAKEDASGRYVHLSTGNYNVGHRAPLYRYRHVHLPIEEIADDATDLFNYLTGYSAKSDYKKLLVAPVNLRERIEGLIEREIQQHAKAGAKAT